MAESKRERRRRRRGSGSQKPSGGEPTQPLQGDLPSGDEPTGPLRGDLPGSLDHSSGADDEFDAALVVGAGGQPADERDLEEAVRESEAKSGAQRRAEVAATEEHHGNRVIGFLRASWSELQRVQWPDRRHVGQGTAVVIGFVAIAGAYLGLADVVAKEIVERIL